MGAFDHLIPQAPAAQPVAAATQPNAFAHLVPKAPAPIVEQRAPRDDILPDNSLGGLMSQAFNSVVDWGGNAIDQEQAAFSAAPVQHGADIARSVPAGAVKGIGSGVEGLAELRDIRGRLDQRGADVVAAENPELAERVQQMADARQSGPSAWLAGQARSIGEAIFGIGEDIAPPEERQTALTQIGEGVGQVATAAIPGRALTMPLQFIGQGADQMADRAREAGTYGTAEGDVATVGGAAVTGIADKLGLDFLLNRVPPAIKNKIIQRMADVGIGATGEGVQEVGEQAAQNALSQAFIDPNQELSEGLAPSAGVGGGTGAVTRFILGMMGVGGAGRGNVDQDIVNEINAAAADDSEGGAAIRSILDGAGATQEQQAAMSPEFREIAEDRLTRRRATDAERAQLSPGTDFVQRAENQQAVEGGDVHPAAVSDLFREPLPETIQVSPYGQGQAQSQAETGINAGMADAGRVRSEIDQDASNAFKLAERQRERAQAKPAPLDTQPAPRPQGQDQRTVHLDEGFPVEILDRRVVGKGNRTYEEATVRRYDPRTGKPVDDGQEYTVPVSKLTTKNYATDPRQSQDFATRAKGPITPERPRQPGDGVTRDPKQTYRTTSTDPNTEFPAAGDGRSPMPEQPAGPAPGRQRPSREDDVIREFAERQRREQAGEQQRARQSGTDYAGKEFKGKFSNKPEAPGADRRYRTDDAGHVFSDKGGPVIFADQKQAAKWIINVGHKTSPDQIFEIVNHPGGKGFSVRESGRSGGPGSDAGANAQPTDAPASGPENRPDVTPRQLAGAAPRNPQQAAPVEPQVETPIEQPAATEAPQTAQPAQAAKAPRQKRRAGKGDPMTQDGPLASWLPPRGEGVAKVGRTRPKKFLDSIYGIVKRKGGIQDDAGELASRDLRTLRPGFINNKSKWTLSNLGEWLRDAGYDVRVDDNSDQYDMNKVYDLLDQELAGRRHVPLGDEDLGQAEADDAALAEENQRRARAQDVARGEPGRRELTEDEMQEVLHRADSMSMEDAVIGVMSGEGVGLTPPETDRQYVQNELEKLGEGFDPEASPDELMDQLLERLAIMDGAGNEGEGDGGNGSGADSAQSESGGPADRDSDNPGAEAGEATGGTDSTGHTGGRSESKADAVKTERTKQGDQVIMPGMEQSARQAQQSREEKRGGKTGSDATQKDADEGLFAEPTDKRQTDFKLTSGVDPTMAWNLLGAPLGRVLFGSRDQLRQAGADYADMARAFKGSQPGSAIRIALRNVFRSSDGAMRGRAAGFKSKTLNDTINKLAVPGGEFSATGKTFEEELGARSNQRRARIEAIFKPLVNLAGKSAADRQRAMTLIANKVRSGRFGPGKLDQIARDVAGFLKEELKYMRDAGVEVGEIKGGYLPREIDRSAVLKGQAKFLDGATRLYQSEAGMNTKDAADAAGRWMTNILHGSEGSPLHGGGAGSPSFVKERVFSKRAEKLLDGFLHDDVESILSTYAYRAAKRAAVARRFGDGWSKWTDIEKAIREEGAAEALPELRDHAAVSTGSANGGMSSGVRTASSLLRTWTTLSLLEKATLSSLGEAFMTASRTGNVFDGLRSAGITAREVSYSLRGKKSELKEFSEDIGALAGSYQNAVMAGTGIDHNDVMGDTQRKVLSAYFHRTGLEAFTNATIAANVRMGGVFLRRLARDIAKAGATHRSSRLYLRELGIPDAKMDAFSKAVVKLGDAYPTMDNMPGELGEMARAAIIRFQRQVVQQPTAASRPRWASHPVGAVAFQLGGWGYSFARNITLPGLKKAKLAVTEKDLGALDRARLLTAMLPGMILTSVVQYGVGELRDLWEEKASAAVSPTGESQRRELTQEAKIERAISRGGLLGALDPYVQTFAGIAYGRDASALWTGPGLGRLAAAINTGASYFTRNSERTNTAERKAASAFYDMVIEPTANFLLTPASHSPLASAATIGVIPALRDWFMNEVAGEKSKQEVRKDKKEPIRGILEDILGQ